MEREECVPLHEEQLTAVRVGQLGRGLGQVRGSIQTQQVVQPRLNRVTGGIPGKGAGGRDRWG
jgi:hypothetical protein